MEPKDKELEPATFYHLDLEKILTQLPTAYSQLVVSVALTHFQQLSRRFMLNENLSLIVDKENGNTRVRLLWAGNFTLTFTPRDLVEVLDNSPMHPNKGHTALGFSKTRREVNVSLDVDLNVTKQITYDDLHQHAVDQRTAKIFEQYVIERGMFLVIDENVRVANQVDAMDIWPIPACLTLNYCGKDLRVIAELTATSSPFGFM